jgi:hypothetical protein
MSRNGPDHLTLFEQVTSDVFSDVAESACDDVHGIIVLFGMKKQATVNSGRQFELPSWILPAGHGLQRCGL